MCQYIVESAYAVVFQPTSPRTARQGNDGLGTFLRVPTRLAGRPAGPLGSFGEQVRVSTRTPYLDGWAYSRDPLGSQSKLRPESLLSGSHDVLQPCFGHPLLFRPFAARSVSGYRHIFNSPSDLSLTGFCCIHQKAPIDTIHLLTSS